MPPAETEPRDVTGATLSTSKLPLYTSTAVRSTRSSAGGADGGSNSSDADSFKHPKPTPTMKSVQIQAGIDLSNRSSADEAVSSADENDASRRVVENGEHVGRRRFREGCISCGAELPSRMTICAGCWYQRSATASSLGIFSKRSKHAQSPEHSS